MGRSAAGEEQGGSVRMAGRDEESTTSRLGYGAAVLDDLSGVIDVVDQDGRRGQVGGGRDGFVGQ